MGRHSLFDQEAGHGVGSPHEQHHLSVEIDEERPEKAAGDPAPTNETGRVRMLKLEPVKTSSSFNGFRTDLLFSLSLFFSLYQEIRYYDISLVAEKAEYYESLRVFSGGRIYILQVVFF